MELSIFIQKTVQENPYEPITIGVTLKKEIGDKIDYVKVMEFETDKLQTTIDTILQQRANREISDRASKRGSTFIKRREKSDD